MKLPKPLSGAASLLRQLARRFYRLGRFDCWFPHVPLAMALGGAGILALLPMARHYALEYFHLRLSAQFNDLLTVLRPENNNVNALLLKGVPITALGIWQIFLAIGLLFKTRLSWIFALIITFTQGVLAVELRHESWVSQPVIYAFGLTLVLLLSGSSFRRTSLTAATLFALAATTLLLTYATVGCLVLGQEFSPPITSLPQAVYFSVVTMSTVGYGDIVPKTDDSRLFVISLIVFGITVFATSITAVVGPLMQNHLKRIIEPQRKRMKLVNHYIIAGRGPLAHNTARELLARDQPVLIVTDSDEDFGEAEVIKGDASDIETLSKAGAGAARAVLALSPDDAENAFVILTLRDMETEAKKVAAVNSRKNLERVRRTQPDMILAPNIFGSEVLAMALTDEKIDSNSLINQLLDVRKKPA